jgi:hypothetical protein
MGGSGDKVQDYEIVPVQKAGALQNPNAGQVGVALDVLRALPPEAVANVVNIVGDVLRARATLIQKNADFLAELELLRANSADRERVMTLVSTVLFDAEINDEAKMKLVDTICQLALR